MIIMARQIISRVPMQSKKSQPEGKRIMPQTGSKYVYPAAGRVITGSLKIISDSRIRSIIEKGPKYRFPVQIDFQKCREKIAGSLNEFCNRWCKREHVECDALKDWKLNIFKIMDRRISFYSQNTNMLPCKPKISLFIWNQVSRLIGSTSWFQQIKLQTTLLLFDGCTTLIL